jgi:AcrR family transcriptional regulator
MRREPRGQTAAEIVDAIVMAAERVLEHEGLDGFSTNRVAELAGVSIGSLYRYFPNKNALARGIYDRHLPLYERMLVGAATGGGSVRDFVLRFGEATLEFFEQRRRIHQALWRLRTAAEVHERIEQTLSAMIELTSRFLQSFGVPAERAADLAFVLVHAGDGVANAVARSGDRELGRRTVAIVAELAESLAQARAIPI